MSNYCLSNLESKKTMEEKVLVLRCCWRDRTSFRGFKWPASGPVECPDWDPRPVCGNGLHGWLFGAGDSRASNTVVNDPNTLWFVVEVLKSGIVDLGGKVKFSRGNVIYCGDRNTAVKMILDKAPKETAVMFQNITCGPETTIKCGDYSNVITDFKSIIYAENNVNIIAKSHCQINAGSVSTITAGCGSTVATGRHSFVNSEKWCNITAGDNSSILTGEYSTFKAGDNSSLAVNWWCSKTGKSGLLFQTFKLYPSHGQLMADTRYKVVVEDGAPKFVEIIDTPNPCTLIF